MALKLDQDRIASWRHSKIQNKILSQQFMRHAEQEGLRNRGGPLGDVLHVLGRQVRPGGPQGRAQ